MGSRSVTCHPAVGHPIQILAQTHLTIHLSTATVPSVLWRCWLGGRKGIRPVKNWVVRCWHGYLSGVRCRLACAQLMPLPLTVSCFSKIQIGFTFLVPAHPGSPRQRDVKRVCVHVLTTAATTDIGPLYRTTYISHLGTGGFCCSKALLHEYPCCWQLAHSFWLERRC